MRCSSAATRRSAGRINTLAADRTGEIIRQNQRIVPLSCYRCPFTRHPAMPTPPETVFKYEPFSVNSLMNLKKQSLHFGPPIRFNDPYDCTVAAQFAEPTLDEIEIMRRCFLERKNLPPGLPAYVESLSQEKLKDFFMKNATKAFEETRACGHSS